MRKVNIFSLLLILAVMVSLGASTSSAQADPLAMPLAGDISAKAVNAEGSSSDTLPSDIKGLLSDYSLYLETGNTSQKEKYTSLMDLLVDERRAYYQKFFNKGLHSKLVDLESDFETEKNVVFTIKDDGYHLTLGERVTMRGNPITTAPENYPPIKAAHWALDHTNDAEIKEGLLDFIEITEEGATKSVNDGVEIVFYIYHDIKMINENGTLLIVKDEFTDKAIDNGSGFDNITWLGNTFIRNEPDWSLLPDYAMYQVPTKELGEKLLANLESVHEKPAPNSNTRGYWFVYDSWDAQYYINRYTSTPPSWYTCGSTSILQNTNFYNPDYEYLWSYNGCNDCADYVSQAIDYGGFTPDQVWKPEKDNVRWNDAGSLWYYLASDDYYYGTIPTYDVNLVTIGDLAFVGNYHVGMVANVNPHLFSGHTNDRYNYPMSGMGFSKYIHFGYYIYHY